MAQTLSEAQAISSPFTSSDVLIYASESVQFTAGVAQLGQRRWDEVPVRNGSQVRILPPAPSTKNSLAEVG
mgnify:CR=1 FL=1